MTRSSNHRTGLAAALGKLIPEAQSATQAVDQAAADRLGLNRTDLRCLGEVLSAGEISASELAERVGLTRGSTTTALDRLEHAGYVRRIADPNDRRGVLIEPTPSAKRAVNELWEPIRKGGLELLERYSNAELSLLGRFFEDYCTLQWTHAERIRKSRKV